MIRHRVIRLRRRDGRGWARGRRARPPARAGGPACPRARAHAWKPIDRVRGEVLVPWGVAEAKHIGFDELLRPVGNDLRWWDIVLGGMTVVHRDIPAGSCLPGVGVLTYYHPAMQDILLQAAEDAGAEVRRGARVTGVEPGRAPRVIVQHDGREREEVCRPAWWTDADSRGSARPDVGTAWVQARPRAAGFFAGFLFEDMRAAAEPAVLGVPARDRAQVTYVFPQGQRPRALLRRLPERRERCEAASRETTRVGSGSSMTGGPDRRTRRSGTTGAALRRTARHVRRSRTSG